MTKAVPVAFVCLGALLLAAGSAGAGLWAAVIPAAFVGAFWGVLEAKEARWAAPIGLALFFLGAAGSVFAGVHPLFAVLGASAALGAWDLSRFRAQLASAAPGSDLRLWKRSHFLRLAAGAGTGAVLAAGAALLRLPAGGPGAFAAVFFAGLAAAWLLRAALKAVARERAEAEKEDAREPGRS
jgi:hypothetical protein